MRIYFARFKHFLRYGHPYRKAAYFAGFALLLIFGIGCVLSLPHADSASAQAGLTIIAQILGVLLGAVLVIVVLLVEQGQRSEELLRGAYLTYRRTIESNLLSVDKARQQLVHLIEKGEIKLDDPIVVGPDGVPLRRKYRDVIGSLIALKITLRKDTLEENEKLLADLGFTEDQQGQYLYGKGILADYDPARFLSLVSDALDLNCLSPCCTNDVSDLAAEVFREYSRDGIDQALSQFETSRQFLRSKSLSAGITVIAATMAAAVISLFGTTTKTVVYPEVLWVLALIITGFVLSILFTLLLIDKIFSR